MIFIEVLIGIYLLGSFIHFQIKKRQENYRNVVLLGHIRANESLKKTLAIGLYLRFRDELEAYKPRISENSIFIKEDSYAFESFVAEVIKAVRGGSVWVTPRTGDHGVDFEHDLTEGKFLGQVKCTKNLIDYEPIAILHSNMIKENAKGGYLITTTDFTDDAKKYANDLGIELIDGTALVDIWLAGFENSEEKIKNFIPDMI